MKINFNSASGQKFLIRHRLAPSLFSDQKVVLEFVQQIVNPQVNDFIQKASGVVADAANITLDKFFNWIGHMFMGEDKDVPEGVAWLQLSDDYVAMKRVSGYWVYTGKLRRQFYAKSGLRSFGEAELLPSRTSRVPFGSTKVLAKSVRLKLMPKLITGLDVDITSLSARDIENLIFARGGFTDEMQRKLRGKRQYYRPLIGPALVQYLKNVVPVEVRKALKQEGFKIRTRGPSVGLGNQFDEV